MKVIVRYLVNHKNFLTQFPEKLMCLRGSHLITEQNDAVISDEILHSGNQWAHGFLDVNDVSSNNEIKRRIERIYLIEIVPIENGVLEILAENGLVDFEVAFESGHDGGDVGEYDVGEAEEEEAHSGDAASGADLDGAFGSEIKEVGVRVVLGKLWWGPAFGEFDEDERARPHGGADVEGAVVLLKRKYGVTDGKIDYRRVCELHGLCVCCSVFSLPSAKWDLGSGSVSYIDMPGLFPAFLG